MNVYEQSNVSELRREMEKKESVGHLVTGGNSNEQHRRGRKALPLPRLQFHKEHRFKKGRKLGPNKKRNKELRPHKYLDQMKT